MSPARLFFLKPSLSCATAFTMAGIALGGPCPGGVSQAASADPGLAVPRAVYRQDEVNHFRITMKIVSRGNGEDQIINIQMRVRETTKEAKADGGRVALYEFESAKLKMGRLAPDDDPETGTDVLRSLPSVTITSDGAGKTSPAFEGGTPHGNTEIGGILQQFMVASDVFRPTAPIKPGDTWKWSCINPNAMLGAESMKGDARYLSIEDIKAAKTVKAQIRGSGSGTDAAEKMHVEGIVNIDTETGRIRRLSQSGDGAFAGSKANVDLRIEAVESKGKP